MKSLCLLPIPFLLGAAPVPAVSPCLPIGHQASDDVAYQPTKGLVPADIDTSAPPAVPRLAVKSIMNPTAPGGEFSRELTAAKIDIDLKDNGSASVSIDGKPIVSVRAQDCPAPNGRK